MNAQATINSRISDIEDFFFEAALATYAGCAEKTTIPDLLGSKVYRYERGESLYVDTYFTNGEWSGGQTLIHFENKPVWIMQYHGWCKNDDLETIRFLKAALRSTYEPKIFNGGRGHQKFPLDTDMPYVVPGTKKRLTYCNEGVESTPAFPIQPGPFQRFDGLERIIAMNDDSVFPESMFWHRYGGMLLIPA